MAPSKNWEDYASDSVKDLVKEIEGYENAHPFDLELVKFLKVISLNPDHCHVLATPLLELSSISVSSDALRRFLDGFGRFLDEVHVTITVVDSDCCEFLLFDSDICDADVLFFHDNKLKIRLEKSKLNRPQWISKYLDLKLRLVDRLEGSEIVDMCRLNVEPKVVYDKQQCLELYSAVYGLVFVHYTYFRYAALASVDCSVEKNYEIDGSGGSEDGYAIVSGAISARFKVRDKLITRVLFDQQDGDPAKLSWSSWLAVPAYSSLEILVDNMVVNEEKIDTSGHNLKFEPHHDYRETVEIVGQKWRFLVTVKWKHVYNFLPQLCECDYADDVGGLRRESIDFLEFEESGREASGQFSEGIEASIYMRQEKRARLQSIEHPPSNVNVIMQRMDPLPSLRIRPLNLVEVFSISVCPYVDNLDSTSLLCGTIKCFDFFCKHYAFNGDENKPSLLCPHQAIPMVEPRRCYTGLGFSMRLDLKDNRGREMSCGYLSWNFNTASLWLDRRMCSIVRGKDGFAAVHYTMFSDAAQARVRVSFVSKNGCEGQVCGRIRARYTGYRYSTQYDREFYQSVLFQKGEDEYVTLHDGDDVPLSKLVVSVPLDEALVVIANLNLVVGGKEEIIRGKVEFQAQEADMPMITAIPQSIGENSALVVSVSWG